MTANELASEIATIYKSISAPIGHSDFIRIEEELMRLPVWLARVGEIRSETEYILTVARGEASHFLAERKLAYNREQREVEFLTAEQQRLHSRAENLGRAINGMIEAYRSVLSFEKEQRRGG